MTDLAPWEEADALDYDSEPAPVEGLARINRLLAALGKVERAAAQYDTIAADEAAEMADRHKRQRRVMTDQLAWLTETLELSHRRMLADGTQSGSVTLPAGDLRVRDGGVSWVWPEVGSGAEAWLIHWLEDHAPETVVRPDPPPARIDKAAAKKALSFAVAGSPQNPVRDDGQVITPDGEIVPGVAVKKKPRTFDAKPYVYEIGTP